LHITHVVKSIGYFLAISLFSLSASSQSLRIGFIDYPPHISFDVALEKKPLYQYMNSVLLPIGFDTEYVKLPRERAAIELFKGRIDILLPVSLDDSTLKTLTSPIFHSVPGLCFKKENFIPILSAAHRFNELTIGVPLGIPLVLTLTNSSAKIIPLKGENAISRGIEMIQRGRFDAFYHPSPSKVYHRKNPFYKEVACSYFHGYSTPIYVAVSKSMPTQKFNLINNAYQKALVKKSYEYYFARRK